jgi:hypothetical protein
MNSGTKITSDHNDASRRRPGHHLSTISKMDELARRVERTYLSRLKMAERLQARGGYWTGALVALTLSSTIASIALLFDAHLYGAHGEVLLVLVGVFVLVASLVIANANYTSRAHRGFETYRKLQRLSVKIDVRAHELSRWTSKSRSAYAAFDAEYQDILDNSDNHSGADFAIAIRSRLVSKANPNTTLSAREDFVSKRTFTYRMAIVTGSRLITTFPLLLATAACAFVVPVVIWVIRGFHA